MKLQFTHCPEIKNSIWLTDDIQKSIGIIYNFSAFFYASILAESTCYTPTYFQTFSTFSKFQIQFNTNIALFIKGYNIEHLFRCKQCRNTFCYVVVKQILSRTHHLFHRNYKRFLHYDTKRISLKYLDFQRSKNLPQIITNF